MNKNKKISKNYKKGGSTFDGQNFYATGGYVPSYGELLDQYFKNGGMIPKLGFGGPGPNDDPEQEQERPKPEPQQDNQPQPEPIVKSSRPAPGEGEKPIEPKPGQGGTEETGEGEGDGTTESSSKNKKGPWMGMGYNLLNAGMMAGNYWNQMQQAGYNNMAMMSQGMTSAAAPRIEGNHGDYTLNSAAFRPDQYSYTTFAMGGSTVPMYEEGGIYDIDESEINRLKSLGYTITPVK